MRGTTSTKFSRSAARSSDTATSSARGGPGEPPARRGRRCPRQWILPIRRSRTAGFQGSSMLMQALAARCRLRRTPPASALARELVARRPVGEPEHPPPLTEHDNFASLNQQIEVSGSAWFRQGIWWWQVRVFLHTRPGAERGCVELRDRWREGVTWRISVERTMNQLPGPRCSPCLPR